jgi:hypothetical protein
MVILKLGNTTGVLEMKNFQSFAILKIVQVVDCFSLQIRQFQFRKRLGVMVQCAEGFGPDARGSDDFEILKAVLSQPTQKCCQALVNVITSPSVR